MIQNPFKFLDAFEKADKDRFFGREKETTQLYTAVHTSNLVLLYGASGTGKTSLVNCGLGNKFYESDWLPLFVRRQDNLNDALDGALRRRLGSATPEAASVSDNIHALYLKHYRPIYLIFDQFEELYILGKQDEQKSFHQTVRDVLQAGLQCKTLFIIREEYIAYLSGFERVLPTLFDNRLRIEKMNDRNLVRVIGGMTGVAQHPRIHIDEPRTTILRIIENLRDRQKGVDLTNLQVYLDRLFREAVEKQNTDEPEQITFDPALVEGLGKMKNVLSDFLDDQLKRIEKGLEARGVTPAQGMPLEVLFTLVTEDGTKRGLDIPSIIEALPRRVREIDNGGRIRDGVAFCLAEFARIRLMRAPEAEGA